MKTGNTTAAMVTLARAIEEVGELLKEEIAEINKYADDNRIDAIAGMAAGLDVTLERARNLTAAIATLQRLREGATP